MSEPTPSSTSAPSPGGSTTGWAAFQHRDFVLLLLVRTVNGMASVMLQLAIGWDMWIVTHDKFMLGLVGLVMFAPNVLFFLAAGTLADRVKRQLVMAGSYAVQAMATLLLLFVFLQPEPFLLLAFAGIFLAGVGRTFSQPAQQSLMPNVVPPEHFANAVAWASSAHQLSVVIGPVIGGALLLLGAEPVFAVIAAGLLINVVFVSLVRARGQEKARGPVTTEALFAGIRYIYKRQIIFGAITLDLFAVIFCSVNALLPVYATDVLGIGASGLGFLRAAIAVGSVSCGLALTHIPVRRHAGRTLMIAVAVYGAATLLFGISTSVWLSLAALALAGAGDMVSVFIRATLVQLATPDDMRGRVAAVHGTFTSGSSQLGDFRAGSMAAGIDLVSAVVIGAVVTMSLAFLWWRWFPRLRAVDSLDVETLSEDAERGE